MSDQQEHLQEEEDVTMAEAGEQQVEEDTRDPEKITILPGASEDGTAVSFQIKNEDHTLGNALRYIIMKNPDVEFCGYSIPHPSEPKMNIRIQTYGKTTAIQAFNKGLNDLVDMCDHIESVFRDQVSAGGYAQED
ncbi:DNA-directed RNA polymerases I and III subunit RPAC2 [Trichomonascus vanleenenianus]|uniref:DNA-directed RNA polymerase core subunit RPC19 n=1 Tax=Trichomonascus vanleenenianus TaxID=2268995 RepID=UPI003ECA52C5